MTPPFLPEHRPNPDALLAQVQADEARAGRGKLRIYFGACAGVGKTYAMLNAARKLHAERVDVCIGVVETHGRQDTAALLEGLPVLALKHMQHREHVLKEFDLDAALVQHPKIILMDELAHSNAPGSRHPKRWQDVRELLDAGINVFTTLNVQHLESLNPVVAGITGVDVQETVPDHVLDDADEVVLVDITANELSQRFQQGKVYLPAQAQRAAANFFRKGNVMALRELALRRTADRVEDDVRAYRVEQSIQKVWATEAGLLVGIGADDAAELVVRNAARLAQQLNVHWHVVYVETPSLQRLPKAQRQQVLEHLQLAENLGAHTAVLTGDSRAQAIAAYAQQDNFSRVVLGRARSRLRSPRWQGWLGFSWPGGWRQSLAQQLQSALPQADLIEFAQTHASLPTRSTQFETDLSSPWNWRKQAPRWAWALLLCTAATGLAALIDTRLDLHNLVMLYLLAVVVTALYYGRQAAAFAAVVSVLLFNFFFVPPRYSFAVADPQYLLTFAVMLAVGLMIGQLTASVRFQARVAAHREQRARAVYEFARELSSALQTEQVVEMTQRALAQAFRTEAANVLLWLPDEKDQLVPAFGQAIPADFEPEIARWSFQNNQSAGFATNTLPGNDWRYVPLKAPMRVRGLLALKPSDQRWLLIPEQLRQLETYASLAAIALERVHFVEVAQNTVVNMESERLRNSLLAALSHDLRTPLTVLVGLAESLKLTPPGLNAAQNEVAQALQDETQRMSRLVNNLLEMAQLQSGKITLNTQWQPLEEVVGSALQALSTVLSEREVQVHLPADLPLLRFDAVLIERVLVNLLSNAAKYTPHDSPIEIRAVCHSTEIDISVADRGPGIPTHQRQLLFEKFVRGETESAVSALGSGLGLGLAICRAIVQAHGGRIACYARAGGGAEFVFTLPLYTPPKLKDEAEQNE